MVGRDIDQTWEVCPFGGTGKTGAHPLPLTTSASVSDLVDTLLLDECRDRVRTMDCNALTCWRRRSQVSLAAITSVRALMIAATGKERRTVIKTAIKQGKSSVYPIGRVLARTRLPVDIHWAPSWSSRLAIA